MPPPPDDDPRWSFELAGGAVMDLGCYALHAHRSLAPWGGGEPQVVGARGAERFGVDEWVEADLRFPGGARGFVYCSMNAQWRGTLRVAGTLGEVTAAEFVLPHRDDRVLVRTGCGASATQRTEHLGTPARPTPTSSRRCGPTCATAPPLTPDGPDAVATAELIDSVYTRGRPAGPTRPRPDPREWRVGSGPNSPLTGPTKEDFDMRLGLIGLGRIGAFHARTLSELAVVDSLVVTDAVPETTAKVAAEVGSRVSTEVADSPAKLLASGVDGVLIAAATNAHPELLLAAVDAGLPVFCEKPIAGDIGDAVELTRRIAGRDERVQIGYPRRFDAGYAAARAAVASGELGWLHTVRATTLDPAPPPPAYVAVSGGIFRDCSVHDFDAIRWVTGREVIEVYAVGGNRGDKSFAEVGDVDTAATTLTLDDGTLALVSNTRYNPRGYDVRLELHGSRDSIAVGLDDGLPLRSVEPGVAFPAGPPHSFFMDRLTPAFRAELAAFTALVAGERPSPCTVADAMEAGWIAEAATLSRLEHRPVRLEEVR